MKPFDEVYLEKAENMIGSMLDYAVYSLRMTASNFFKLFIACGAAELYESGDPGLIAGMSGVELAYYVMEQSGLEYERIRPRFNSSLSKEHMGGVILARFQWTSGMSFDEIISRVMPLSEIINLYDNRIKELQRELLEAWPPVMDANSPEKKAARQAETLDYVCARLNEKMSSTQCETHLKTLRSRSGLSQSQLAEASGVPVRTIQQYEQRQKNINKAQFEYLLQLANALNCDPKELYER